MRSDDTQNNFAGYGARSAIPDDHVVQTFPQYGTDQPLHIGILPGRPRRTLLHSHVSGGGGELTSVDSISIAQHILWRLTPGERLAHLLYGPLLRGVFGYPEVQHTTPMVREQDDDKQNPEGRRGHREKVDGRSLGQMICQERSSGLGGRLPRTRQIPSHRRLRHHNPPTCGAPYECGVRPTRGWLGSCVV